MGAWRGLPLKTDIFKRRDPKKEEKLKIISEG
jgi:hypothetical protein